MIGFALFFLQTATAQPQAKQLTAVQKKATTQEKIMESSRSTMIIEPKARAADYKEAYQLLAQEKSTAKVFFELADGSRISNVIDMKMMPNNTLIVFRYSTPQGIKFQVVEIEDVVGIMHQ